MILKVIEVRIIGGKNKGRNLLMPQGSLIRPTSDRIRESIFNILNSYLNGGFSGKVIADLFSGTGALGLEALSRGAQSAILVDKQSDAINLIKTNAEKFEEKGNVLVLKRDATRIGPLPNGCSSANIAFLDPPYEQDMISTTLGSLIDNNWLASNALCVLEMSVKETFNCRVEFEEIVKRKYGKTLIYIVKYNG
jgi:16S rRNA (guanine966-N2)-methyltransferase